MEHLFFFYVLLFVVAFLYASVGHGGASGYLALMAIFGFAPETMKPTALLLNLFVSLIAFIQYYRGKHFNWKMFLPFAIASIPLAFLGGRITVDALVYKKILGLLLLVPIARFLFFPNLNATELKSPNFILSLCIGGIIGLLSGMIGIGGGILLSPVLLLLKWADMKRAAAISSLFIFVNSIAGLAGQFSMGLHFTKDMFAYAIIAIIGGLLGSYLGAMKFNQTVLKYALSLVLLLAAFKLLYSSGG
jgi:uncharacterized protein